MDEIPTIQKILRLVWEEPYKVISRSGNTHNEKHQVYLSALELDSNDAKIIIQYIRHVRYLNKVISTLEDLIAGAVDKNEYAKLVMSIPGFGPSCVTTSIDNIRRFGNPKKLISYMVVALFSRWCDESPSRELERM